LSTLVDVYNNNRIQSYTEETRSIYQSQKPAANDCTATRLATCKPLRIYKTMVAQTNTCSDCPNFTRSKVLPHVGFCTLYLENTRSHDVAGVNCPSNQKRRKPKTSRQPQSVELVEISGWIEDKASNTVYKLSSWKVKGSTGNTYDVLFDSRGSVVCNCPGHTTHKHCYHADSVRQEWEEWQQWSNEKNALDLARNDGF